MKNCFSYLISGCVLAGLGVVPAAGKVVDPAVHANEYAWRQETNSVALLNSGKVVWQLKYRILVHGGAVDRAFLGNEWKRYGEMK